MESRSDWWAKGGLCNFTHFVLYHALKRAYAFSISATIPTRRTTINGQTSYQPLLNSEINRQARSGPQRRTRDTYALQLHLPRTTKSLRTSTSLLVPTCSPQAVISRCDGRAMALLNARFQVLTPPLCWGKACERMSEASGLDCAWSGMDWNGHARRVISRSFVYYEACYLLTVQ